MKNEWINAFLLILILAVIVSFILYEICQEIQFPLST